MATITSTPSLTLRALLSRAAARAALDRSAPLSAGLTPAAKALAAVVSARTSTEATLLVAPSDKDVEQLTADARFFYGALEGASEAAVDRAIRSEERRVGKECRSRWSPDEAKRNRP